MAAAMVLPVDPTRYSAFLVAMALLAVSPGPAIMFFVRTGLAGRKINVFAGVVGVNAATLVWFAGSAIGLQMVVSAFPLVFQVMAVLGGAYVVWLGLNGFRHALNSDAERIDPRFLAADEVHSPGRTLREGFMVQMLNPKVLLFFTAILPPFLDSGRSLPPQMGVFAATAVTLDAISMTTYGLAAVSLSTALKNPRNRQVFDILAGCALMLIGALILVHAAGDLLMPH